MTKRDVRIVLTHKEAKLLEKALAKGVFDKLTPAQADAISEFTFNLHCGIEEADWEDSDDGLGVGWGT